MCGCVLVSGMVFVCGFVCVVVCCCCVCGSVCGGVSVCGFVW